jgi:hypothetical protein
MGNLFGKKVLPAKSESFDSTTVQPASTYSAVASENREKDGRKKRSPKKRSKKRSLKKKRT